MTQPVASPPPQPGQNRPGLGTSQPAGEDRFSRFRLIGWWDQEKIRSAHVLVIGAGALGNEILKNLALLGFTQIVVVDLDAVEASNLSRSILYRTEDIGRAKADAAAEAVRNILPEVRVQPIRGDVVHGLGLGLFHWADLVLAGLDNREARLWINRACWKMNRPWIDGAIEGINGVVRVFLPGRPPCYECTLGEVDWALLEKRLSCNLLALDPAPEGKVPTTPTISSIIAGIQVQEAVKLIHGLPTLSSKGYVFEGMNHSSYAVEYTENPDCMSHHTVSEIVHLRERSDELTLEELFQRSQADLGAREVVIEFTRDIVSKFVCPACGTEEPKFAAMGSIPFNTAHCPADGQLRTVVSVHSFSGVEEFGKRRLSELGLPLLDLFLARHGEREIGYIPAGDAQAVLGNLARKGVAAGS